jgi:DNA-binding NarL/FixJ family response regulator
MSRGRSPYLRVFEKSKLDVVRVHIAALTPREREVFALIVRGNTNKHIARALGATERTIKGWRKCRSILRLNWFPLLNELAYWTGVDTERLE